MAYLMQNFITNDVTKKYAVFLLKFNSQSFYSICLSNETNFINIIRECNFSKRLNSCNLKTNENEPRFSLNIYDLMQHVKMVKFIFDII